MDEDIRGAFIQLAQAATVQTQAMTAKANRQVVPYPYQQVTTMASHLREFTRMNHLTFYRSMVDEDPQEFINDVSKILFSMKLNTS